jgi:ubiquinone/menaquinone biosynthesis C-methylase UbiE
MNLLYEPKFLDPEKTLFAAGLTKGQSIADLGAGSGFYSLAAGKLVGERGMVYAVDVLESALDHLAAEARVKEIRNVKLLRCDLEQPRSCLSIPEGSLDYVLLANLVHQIKNRKELFQEVYRLLKTGGKLIALEWNDEPTVLGPQVADRLPPAVLIKLATQTNLKEAGRLPTDNYHYGLMFIK